MIKLNILKQKNYPGGINAKYSYSKEAEGDLAHREEGGVKTVQREIGNTGFEDLSDQATSQGTLAATRSWKRQKMDSLPRA